MFDRNFFESLTFRVMNDTDKMGFAGVTSPVPLISDNSDFLVVVDGVHAEIYDEDAELIETIEDVTLL